MADTKNLVERLRRFYYHDHDDEAIMNEAADTIEKLVKDLRNPYNLCPAIMRDAADTIERLEADTIYRCLYWCWVHNEPAFVLHTWSADEQSDMPCCTVCGLPFIDDEQFRERHTFMMRINKADAIKAEKEKERLSE